MMGKCSKRAMLNQGGTIYPGYDKWKDCIIEKGTVIVQFDWRSIENIKKSNEVASTFFSSENAFEKSKDDNGRVSAKKYADLAQVFPRSKNYSNNTLHYPDKIIVYNVLEPIPAAKSIAENNPIHGNGGAVQYHLDIPKERLISEKYLERKEIFFTMDTHQKQEWIKRCEAKGVNKEEIELLIPEKHRELISEWQQGTLEQRERAGEMIELGKEAESLRMEYEKGAMENDIPERIVELDTGQEKSQEPEMEMEMGM